MTRPFRLTAPVTPEDDLHTAVAHALDRLLLPPATWTTFPAGQVELTAQAAAKLARLGLKAGWPDLLVLHGVLHGIELKTLDGRLSRTRSVRTRRGTLRLVEGQQDTFPRLEAAGMKIAVCRTVGEVLTALAAWNIPVRRTAS